MKNTMIILQWMITVVLFVLVAAPCDAFGGPRRFPYALIVLPDSTGTGSGAVGLNNQFVVGDSNLSDFTFHATVWGRQGMYDLGTLGGLWSVAGDINNKNEIVGWAAIPGGNVFDGNHAFLWKNGTMTDLGTLGSNSSIARAINDNGVVVGESEDAQGIQWGFLWQDGKMFNLGGWLNPEGMLQANDINSEGIVVGVSWSYVLGKRIATKRDVNGKFIPLPDLDGIEIESGAYAINDRGRIAGKSKGHAVIWEDGQVLLIENISHDGSLAYGINNFGEVVGFGGDANPLSDTEGWVWDDAHGNIILNTLRPPNTGFWIELASDINDNHQIIGKGFYRNPKSPTYGFLFTPVDPELVLGEPVPGVAGVVNSFTVSGARPGAEVSFVYGMKGGGRFVPHCDVLKAVLQIDDAVVMGKGIADGDGVARIEMFVPDRARDEDILMMQCFDEGNCEESELLVVSFQ